MDQIQFAEQLHKLGYETNTDGGALIIIGKHDNFDDNLKEARSLVKEYGYNCSWGVRGKAAGTITSAGKKSDNKKAEIISRDSQADNHSDTVKNVDASGAYEQMSFMDLL